MPEPLESAALDADREAIALLLRFVGSGAEARVIAASDSLSTALLQALPSGLERVALSSLDDAAALSGPLAEAGTAPVVLLIGDPAADDLGLRRPGRFEAAIKSVLDARATPGPTVFIGLRQILGGESPKLFTALGEARSEGLLRWQVTGIVEGLPSRVPDIHPSVEFATAVFEPLTDPAVDFLPLRMFRASQPGRAGDALWHGKDRSEALAELYRRAGGAVDGGYVLRAAPDWSRPITFDRLHPGRQHRSAELAIYGELVDLRDLVRPIRGLAPTQRSVPAREGGAGDTVVVDGRMLREHEIVGIEDARRIDSVAPGHLLEPGDILIRGVVHPGWATFPIAVVPDGAGPMVAGSNVIALRPQLPTGPARTALVAFLRSERFRDELRAEKVGLHIHNRLLEAIKVPVLDASLEGELKRVAEAEAVVAGWLDEVRRVESSIFLARSPALAKRQLVDASQLLLRRVAEGQALDNFDHRVSSQYPFPLAYRWRVLRETANQTERLDAVTDTAEALCAFMALVGAAIVSSREASVAHFTGMRQRGSDIKTNFGDWIRLLDELSSGRHKDRGSPALSEIRRWWSSDGTSSSIGQIAAVRNARGHGRRPTASELPSVVESTEIGLERALTAAEFVMRLSFVWVEEARWDRIRQQSDVQVRNLRGDHPVLRRDRLVSPHSDIETGSAYLVEPDDEWICLRPLLVARACPECSNWATFYPDEITSGYCSYKALEHGHTWRDPATDGLRHVGLWPPEGRP